MKKRAYKKRFKTNRSFQKAQIFCYNNKTLSEWQRRFVIGYLDGRADKIRSKIVRYYLRLGVRWWIANGWSKYGSGGSAAFNRILKERSIVYFYPKKNQINEKSEP